MNIKYPIVVVFLQLIIEISTLTPSKRLEKYITYQISDQGVCKSRRLPLIDNVLSQENPIMLRNPSQGAIFRQTWNSSSMKRFSYCKFTLQPPEGMNFYLVIREAGLRRDDRGQCVDTIGVRMGDVKYTFCSALEDDYPKVFGLDGPMRISINLDKTLPLDLPEDELVVEMVVTIRKPCISGESTLKCSVFDSSSCISEHFWHDGIVNCPACGDERTCFGIDGEVPIMNPRKVVFSALVSTIVAAVVFGACLCCLLKYRRSLFGCGSGSDSNNRDRSSAGNQPSRVNLTMHGLSSNNLNQNLSINPLAVNDNVPSAPPEEEDLPPSYDALYNTAAKERLT